MHAGMATDRSCEPFGLGKLGLELYIGLYTFWPCRRDLGVSTV